MWEKLQPVEATTCGCLNCSVRYKVAPMEMQIAVGFGWAGVQKNGETVWSEIESCRENWDNCWTVQDAENAALEDPDNDWRIIMDGPLHGETYQRQNPSEWVLVDKNIGFA